MEISPNYTIPALLPLPGADSLVQLPLMGDGQYWPLASIGTDVEATTTPLPWQQIFRVTTRGRGGMSLLDRRSRWWPQTAPVHQRDEKTTINQQREHQSQRRAMAGKRALAINDGTTTTVSDSKQRRAGADEWWDRGQQSGWVALEDGLSGTGVRGRMVRMRMRRRRRRRTRRRQRSATLFADKNTHHTSVTKLAIFGL